MPRASELIGQKFGKLTVISESHRDGQVHWNCLCDCGGTKIVISRHLRLGCVASCGCLYKKPYGKSAFNRLFRMYKDGAKNRGLSFALTEEKFTCLTKGNCHYCGTEPKTVQNKNNKHDEYLY